MRASVACVSYFLPNMCFASPAAQEQYTLHSLLCSFCHCSTKNELWLQACVKYFISHQWWQNICHERQVLCLKTYLLDHYANKTTICLANNQNILNDDVFNAFLSTLMQQNVLHWQNVLFEEFLFKYELSLWELWSLRHGNPTKKETKLFLRNFRIDS